MALNRRLAPMPAAYDLDQLTALTRSRYASLVAVNTVDDAGVSSLAAYWDGWSPSAASLDLWRADVAAHVPAHPTAEEQLVAATANEASIKAQLVAALATLQAVIDAPDINFGTVQAAQTQVRGLQAQTKDLARILRRVIRVVTGQLQATD